MQKKKQMMSRCTVGIVITSPYFSALLLRFPKIATFPVFLTTRLRDDGSRTPRPLVPAGVCCPDAAGLRGPVSSRSGSPGAARRPAAHLGPGQHLPCHAAAVGSHGSRSLPPHSLPPCPTCGHAARRHVPDSHPRHDCDSSRREPFRCWRQRLSSLPFSVVESAAWGEGEEDWQGVVQGGELISK